MNICKYCGKEFTKTTNASKYCKTYCRDRMRIIKKRIIQKKRNKTDEPRPCKGCGKEMRFYGMSKYCKNFKSIRRKI